MFRKPFLFSLSAFIGVTSLVGLCILHRNQNDLLAYKKLEESSCPKEKVGGLTHYCEQIRTGVVKELWLTQKKAKAFRISSAESELFFFNEGKTLEVIEQLKNVKCFIREDDHSIRYMEAKEASYNYNTQLFVAVDVTLWKYPCKGLTLPLQPPQVRPLMKGVAESVEILLKEEDILFKAHHLKATFEEKT